MSQRFKEDYTRSLPSIVKSKVGIHHAYCCLCKVDFSIRHSGYYDCRTHCQGSKHTKIEGLSKKKQNLFDMGIGKPDINSTVMNAECLMVKFLVEHNLPMTVADHITPLVKQMFPDKTGLSQGSQSSQSSQSSQEDESHTETVQSDMSGRVLGLLSNAE
jgi:hypothetical protein